MKPLDIADMLIERLVFGKHNRRVECNDRRHFVNLWSFDRVDVTHFVADKNHPGYLISNSDDRRTYFDPNVLWPFHVQFAQTANNEWPENTIQISDVKSCELKTARNLGATIFARKMVQLQHLFLTPQGAESAFSVSAFVGNRWVNARRIRGWQSNGSRNNTAPNQIYFSDDENHNPVAIAQSMALTQRYEWAVRVGFNEGPKVRFSTDPAGLRAMFRDRDKPADRDRRAPLRHWVRDHWRKSRKDDEAMNYVLAHLRGQERFAWWGYDCVIEPSQYDLDRLAKKAEPLTL